MTPLYDTDPAGHRWQRVTLPAARKALLAGHPVVVVPVCARPFSGYWPYRGTITAHESIGRYAAAMRAAARRDRDLYPAFYVEAGE